MRRGCTTQQHESDSCGVAMITDIQGSRSHAIVADGLVALEHLEHRGAAGAETNSGDGAGILIQLPVELFREVVDFDLPAPTADGCNTFAAGICFLPLDPAERAAACEQIDAIANEEGLQVLGWRELPVDPDGCRSRCHRTRLHALHGAAFRQRRPTCRRNRPRPPGLPAA